MFFIRYRIKKGAFIQTLLEKKKALPFSEILHISENSKSFKLFTTK